MGDLVDFVARVLRESGAWAGLIFGLLAFAESTAFLGALVPATRFCCWLAACSPLAS
jgi:hypothetical protein